MILYVRLLSPREFRLTQEQTQRMDLIVFDSSFIPETREMANATHETDFERLWASVGNPINSARGWCDASVDKVVKSLQIWDRQYVKVIPANVAPFIGRVFEPNISA